MQTATRTSRTGQPARQTLDLNAERKGKTKPPFMKRADWADLRNLVFGISTEKSGNQEIRKSGNQEIRKSGNREIGNWELGIGNWELGIGNWELGRPLTAQADSGKKRSRWKSRQPPPFSAVASPRMSRERRGMRASEGAKAARFPEIGLLFALETLPSWASYPQIFPELIARFAVLTGVADGLPVW